MVPVDLWLDATILAVLILLSAFFSGAETALTSMGRVRLRRLVVQDEGKFGKLLEWERQPRQILAAILIGNNIVNIGASSFATLFTIKVLERIMSGQVTGELAVLAATIVMTLVIVVFGEITPKTIAATFPAPIAVRVIRPLVAMRRLLAPMVWLTSGFAYLVLYLLGERGGGQAQTLTRADMRDLIRIGAWEGAILPAEEQMAHAVFKLEARNLRDIMIPRTSMNTLPADCTVEAAIERAGVTGHSRIPAVGQSVDDVVGILFVKDLVGEALSLEGRQRRIADLLRPAMFVPGTMRVDVLLEQMRRDRVHLAIVLDEFGGVAGLITMEDLLEEIVGSIHDEYDKVRTAVTVDAHTGAYIADGTAPLVDLERVININFDDVRQDTLSGWLSAELGHIPRSGEAAERGGFRFEVLSASRRSVHSVRITPALVRDPRIDPPDPPDQQRDGSDPR